MPLFPIEPSIFYLGDQVSYLWRVKSEIGDYTQSENLEGYNMKEILSNFKDDATSRKIASSWREFCKRIIPNQLFKFDKPNFFKGCHGYIDGYLYDEKNTAFYGIIYDVTIGSRDEIRGFYLIPMWNSSAISLIENPGNIITHMTTCIAYFINYSHHMRITDLSRLVSDNIIGRDPHAIYFSNGYFRTGGFQNIKKDDDGNHFVEVVYEHYTLVDPDTQVVRLGHPESEEGTVYNDFNRFNIEEGLCITSNLYLGDPEDTHLKGPMVYHMDDLN